MPVGSPSARAEMASRHGSHVMSTRCLFALLQFPVILELVKAAIDHKTLLTYATAAQHGDDVALGQLVRSTQATVWRFCANFSSVQEADDLTQEVFIRAARGLSQYRGEAPVISWLLSIARHVCADQVRRNQRRARLATRLRNERTLHHQTGSSLDMMSLLDSLHPDRKLAFVLTQVIGLSYEEAANVCECPIGTIRSRVARAREDLVVAVRSAEAR
jgi:RNA polymerase sigma-70 factor, ECF subfamily